VPTRESPEATGRGQQGTRVRLRTIGANCDIATSSPESYHSRKQGCGTAACLMLPSSTLDCSSFTILWCHLPSVSEASELLP
jgi:hypothetical protein